MNKIYCISGLGADHRIFKKLRINDYQLVPLPWVAHSANDTIATYAIKMAQQILEPMPIILGVSFGGMVALEISKVIPTKAIIIVSSAKSQAELPYNGIFWKMLVSLLPHQFFTLPNPLIIRLFGAKTSEEKKLIGDIFRESDGRFVKWSLKAILNWHNHSVPQNLLQIHGTNDLIIPGRNVSTNHWIQGGSHIMIYNQAEQISEIINQELDMVSTKP